MAQLDPWGTTLPPGVPASEAPGSFGTDPDNNMIYVQDWIVSGSFAIKLDQSTGDMEVVWSRPDWRTSDYYSLVGPGDQRVLISQNIDLLDFSQLADGSYMESVLWADATTGKTLAESEFGPSTAIAASLTSATVSGSARWGTPERSSSTRWNRRSRSSGKE